jgi:hypothetical protein
VVGVGQDKEAVLVVGLLEPSAVVVGVAVELAMEMPMDITTTTTTPTRTAAMLVEVALATMIGGIIPTVQGAMLGEAVVGVELLAGEEGEEEVVAVLPVEAVLPVAVAGVEMEVALPAIGAVSLGILPIHAPIISKIDLLLVSTFYRVPT